MLGELSKRGSALVARTAFKRTLIPPTLTLGMLLVATGVFALCLSQDFVLGNLPRWVDVSAIAVGLLLLAAAAVNIFQVRSLLKS